MGPLLPDPGTRSARWQRRAKGVAIELVAFVAITVTLPLLLPVAAAVDVMLKVVARKRHAMGVRLVLLGWWFLAGELRGIALLTAINAAALGRDTRTRRRRVYRLRQRWTGGHLAGINRIFELTYEIEGLELVAPGPVVVFTRHASIIDNALPDALLGKPHGLGFRFVIKRELEVLPTIDVGGRWVPTVFVQRASGDTTRELDAIRTLAIDLEPDEGIAVYPEGTRHTTARAARAQEVIAERQPHLAPLARGLKHLLPPRLGGPVALLDATADRGIDVVFCGHVGFDGFRSIKELWAGGLVGETIRMKLWRVPASEIPPGHDERIVWLYEQWQRVDDWVGEQRARSTAA
ncbi:MAG TPA: 1-acyl-sn-glycerol-3-phosphate acyltransferase [Solirubrobacteraceae bacterium]|nr:1-acyl-sn-glycerol-3-phosphate acyltransferase [Solirubrobacteraceae bacterium]